jgi:hypothetical protein
MISRAVRPASYKLSILNPKIVEDDIKSGAPALLDLKCFKILT